MSRNKWHLLVGYVLVGFFLSLGMGTLISPILWYAYLIVGLLAWVFEEQLTEFALVLKNSDRPHKRLRVDRKRVISGLLVVLFAIDGLSAGIILGLPLEWGFLLGAFMGIIVGMSVEAS